MSKEHLETQLTILKIHVRESAITSVSSTTEFLNANGPDSLSETATVNLVPRSKQSEIWVRDYATVSVKQIL